jgi:K+-sensing histidine kinase KdpD
VASDLVAETAELIRRALGEAIAFEMRAEAGLWPCRIDPAQFEAAILNLVLNARDAMPTGGSLTIAASNESVTAKQAEALNGIAPGDYVRIDVTDSGTGMAPDVQARVFEPFFTTKEVGKGSGLGLAQVHGFVHQSGGTILVDSGPGRGTRISLLFPRFAMLHAEEHELGETAKQTEEAASGAVLLVEDDPGVLDVAQSALISAGHLVVPAHDAICVSRVPWITAIRVSRVQTPPVNN